jgi:CubicO group peptidase (beta-lactamase class C family)
MDMEKRISKELVLWVIFGVVVIACGIWFIRSPFLTGFDKRDLSSKPKIIVEYWPTEGWKSASPSDFGMDQNKLNNFIDYVKSRGSGIDSVTIVKEGYIVLDEYFGGFKKGEKHNIYSCTKSVVSTLFGIAQKKGYVGGLDTRIVDLFSELNIQNMDQWKQQITLMDLLTMRAGFDARDSYLYDWEGLRVMLESSDTLQYILDLPMSEKPGIRFEYTNGVSHLLSHIVSISTGVKMNEFAEDHLFKPLGIESYEWETDEKNVPWGFSNLYITPHDMAKIGYLFLCEGKWEDKQIVTNEWVEKATIKHTDATIKDGYGYQWWIDSDGYYLALGYFGQFIFVVPDHNLVVVLTGHTKENFDFSIRLLESHIIPAIIK